MRTEKQDVEAWMTKPRVRITMRLWLAFLVIVLSIAGCEGGQNTTTATNTPLIPTPTRTPEPTSPNPTVAISPTSGPPGTEVQVTAAGFPPGVEIDLGAGPRNSKYDVLISPQTDADGFLDKKLAIPISAEPGEEWVIVAMTKDGSIEAFSNSFEVVVPQYEPEVKISPTSGPPGTEVQVEIAGFPSNTMVEIGVGRVNSEYDVIATAQADGNGRAATQITIPAFVEPTDAWVIVVAAKHRSIKAVSDEFDVTPGLTPTPSDEDLFTRTTIYLIAIGDDGQIGKAIGCDDSVVPVEVEIDPTIAPLTAALNKLLALETREYGQSGLYNALYRSDLTLEGIDIEDGAAIIELSGDLVLGGACDNPRVRAQLQQTALQYATVDQVTIFINGEPLDDVLAQN